MIEPNYINEMDIDISGDFFDHIDDLLNFPNEDVEGGVVGEDFNGFQGIWSDPPDALVGSASVFSNNSTNNSSELPTDLSVSNEDIAHLEWLSNFVEDSFSAGSIILDEDLNENNNNNNNNNSNNNKDTHQFRTSSPVESSSSCSEGKTETKKPLSPQTIIPGRARSKRPRPATFNPRSVHPLISSPSSITDSIPPISTTSEFENFAESHPSKKIMKPEVTEENKKKKKEKKLPRQSGTIQSDLLQQPITVRKCLHCEITKTPQWRTGPMGPKTLCNACGVRHKSGRLFPEYRPAASPTFVASLHSCSHKKVLEMRIKDGGQKISADENVSTMMTTANLPELIPRSSYLPDYI